MRAYLATVAACLLVVSAALGRSPDDDAAKADQLAAGSLHHSVRTLRHASGKPTARAARMVGLAEFARRLSPDDPDINNTIAYISLVRNNEKALAQAIRKSFQARPRDHALALQWLASEMKGFQDAQSRSVFLDGVTRDSNRTSELRAAAAVHLADILIGQGKREQAVKAFDTAVKLDPDLPAAMEGRLTLAEKVSPADRAAILVGQFIVNPHAVRHAAQFGEIL